MEFEREKIGQEDLLFDAIAPWVREGSYIEMSGEDDAMWRWVFRGGGCHEVTPTITWEDPADSPFHEFKQAVINSTQV